MTVYQQLTELYPYPAPSKPVQALLDFLNDREHQSLSPAEAEKFQLIGVYRCEKGQCRCICGRPILQVFQVSHLDYAISFGLGSECVKRFFPELKLREIMAHRRWLVKLIEETEEAMAAGLMSGDSIFLDAAEQSILTYDQGRRLSRGLPLTLTEYEALRVQLDARQLVLKRHKQALARKALAISGHKSTPEAFKFLLAKLESGGEIQTLEALQQINLADLAKNLDTFEPLDRVMDVPLELSSAQVERGRVLLSIVTFLATQRQYLTPTAQRRLLEIEAIVREFAENSAADEATEQLCLKRLLRREIQQELVNMGNQLGINLTMEI